MATTWGDLLAACKRLGLTVEKGKGGERKIVGPGLDGRKQVMRIGHKCCKSSKSVVYIDYVKKFERRFGSL